MSVNEKDVPVQGLTISHPEPTAQEGAKLDVRVSVEDADSTHTLTPTPTTSDFYKGTGSGSSSRDQSPFSPFRNDCGLQSESKLNINVNETDLEACNTETKTILAKKGSRSPNIHCTVWPGQQSLKERKKAMRRSKGCHPLARFSKRTSVIIKVVIGLCMVGMIIGVGLGVSKAVGGGIYMGSNKPNVS